MKIESNIKNGDFLMPQGNTEALMLAALNWTCAGWATSRSSLSGKIYRAAQLGEGSGCVVDFSSTDYITPFTPVVLSAPAIVSKASADPDTDTLIVRAQVEAIERSKPFAYSTSGPSGPWYPEATAGNRDSDDRMKFRMDLSNEVGTYGTICELDVNSPKGMLCVIACPLQAAKNHILSFSFDTRCMLRIVKVWASVATNKGA